EHLYLLFLLLLPAKFVSTTEECHHVNVMMTSRVHLPEGGKATSEDYCAIISVPNNTVVSLQINPQGAEEFSEETPGQYFGDPFKISVHDGDDVKSRLLNYLTFPATNKINVYSSTNR